MKKPKQPKPRKLPKKPKQSAPPASWIRWEKRAHDVRQHNAHRLSEWKRKCAKIESDAKRKQAIIRKYS